MSETGVSIHETFQSFPFCLVHLCLNRAHAGFHINDILLGSQQFFVDGTVSPDVLILCQIADFFVFHENSLSFIGWQLVHDNTEKRGFAGTIVADQSCFFPFFYMKRSILQDDFFAKRFADALT